MSERRERAAAVRKAQQRKERQRTMLVGLVIAALLLVGGIAVAWQAAQTSKAKADAKAQEQLASKQFITTLTSIPAATFDAAGAPSKAPKAPTKLAGAAPMSAGKLPRVVYVGAEYCPYCAMQRWPLVAALSRFGSFDGLAPALSSANEGAVSNIATVTFKDAAFTSDYLAFQGWEIQDRDQQPLQTLPDDVDAFLKKYDVPPLSSPNPGSIPFVGYGGQWASAGATYDGALLVGKTNGQIATDMTDPTTDVGKAALQEANVITAQLCVLTKNQPGEVCTSKAVVAASRLLNK